MLTSQNIDRLAEHTLVKTGTDRIAALLLFSPGENSASPVGSPSNLKWGPLALVPDRAWPIATDAKAPKARGQEWTHARPSRDADEGCMSKAASLILKRGEFAAVSPNLGIAFKYVATYPIEEVPHHNAADCSLAARRDGWHVRVSSR